MDTNSLAQAMQVLIAQPEYQNAFNSGLYLAAVIVAGCLAFSMLRTIAGDNHEDL